MLAYSPVDAAAIPALRERLAHQPYRSCDYTAGVIYMWRDYFSTEYALCGDTLYIRMRYPDGQVYHLFPCGSEAPALSLSRIAFWRPVSIVCILSKKASPPSGNR